MLGNWIRILWFVSILVNSSGISKRMVGKNVIGGSFITIECLPRSCRTVSGRRSHFSQQLSAAAMPVCFERPCMKSTFHEFNGGMPTLQLIFFERESHCSLL